MDRQKTNLKTQTGFLYAAAIVAISVLIASTGLLVGLKENKLIKGYDATAYAILSSEFHENFSTGNYIPSWAGNLRFGFGEPHLQFRPPLQNYVTEFFLFLTKDLFSALHLSALFFLIASGIGMYLFARTILLGSELWPALVASAYVLSPYYLRDLYVRAAFSEFSTFAILPWASLAFFKLAKRPTPQTFVFASFAYATIAIGHTAIHMFSLPFLILAHLYWRQNIQRPFYSLGAVAFGLLASSFYWGVVLAEKNLVKSLILSEGYETYPQHFSRLDQFIYMPWSYGEGLGFSYTVGAAILVALGWAAWVWAKKFQTIGSKEIKTISGLLVAILLCLYFSHRTSTAWYELFPWLQTMTFPWRFHALTTFFGAILFGFFAKYILNSNARILAAFGLICSFGMIEARPIAGYLTENVRAFTGEAIATNGLGFAKHALTPSSVATGPNIRPENLVEFVQGRGEAACNRNSPTFIKCQVMAIQNSTLRLNIFYYDGWTVTINGKAATNAKIEKNSGAQLISITPGKQEITWELRNNTTKVITKVISLISIIVLFIVLLFQKQITQTQTFFKQRKKNLQRSTTARTQ